MTPKLHRQFLDLADDFSPRLAADMRRIGPVKMPNRKHLGISQFLARVIIGQQVSTKAAMTIWGRIKTAAKEADEKIPAFFCEDNVHLLRASGASGNKAKALLAINEAYSDGRIAPARLRRLDQAERNKTLLEIRGVGPWTVDMADMFYFAETDIWPIGDLAVERTFNSYLTKKQLPRSDDYLARFVPNRSFLAFYMWQVLDNVP